MIKKIFVVAAMLYATGANAQFVKTTVKESNQGWQNLSPQQDGVYGAEIDKAYDFLKGKPSQKRVTVALIGAGVDIEHTDLVNSIWTNPKEKLNGKDDDKNGLVDDVHGWNFLGNSQGEVLDATSSEGDREFMRLKDKYAKILSTNMINTQRANAKYYVFDDATQKLVEVAAPKDMTEYLYFTKTVMPNSRIASAFVSDQMMKVLGMYVNQWDKELKGKYPSKEVTKEDFFAILDRNKSDDDIYTMAISIPYTAMNYVGQYIQTWEQLRKYLMDMTVKSQYENALAAANVEDRKLVGDNNFDLKDKLYGNNILITENAGDGTLLAGVIGAQRDSQARGIADDVQIMTLRVKANEEGELYMKDLTLAIRYAVDHGADIIQMPPTNRMVPADQKKWLDEALTYAGKKGVLVVQPVRQYSMDMDQRAEFPNNANLSNFITVAASDENGNPYLESNYGKLSLDLFAPGTKIYTTYLGDTYRSESGNELAGAMVTGVAALIKSRYPKLTPAQIKELLVRNVTSRKGEEAEKNISVFQDGTYGGVAKDVVDFGDLSVSGGILNADQALRAAAEIAK